MVLSSAKAGEVLVLNASSGIGQALVSKLQEDKKQLILTARSINKLGKFQRTGTHILPLTYSEYGHDALKQYLEQNNPNIEGVVIITPTQQTSHSIFPATEEWEMTLKECYISPLEALKTVYPYLENNAKIVVVGGLVGVNVLDFRPHSAVIRMMWIAKAKELSRQLAPQGIHVNTLSPGGTLTDRFKEGIAKRAENNNISYEEQLAREVSDLPLGQYNDPSNVANSIAFLLSRDSDLITGTNLVIDSGYNRAY